MGRFAVEVCQLWTRKNTRRRVAEFQTDLLQMETIGVIRKHITTGTPAALNDGTYFELRNEVADHFELHPSQVLVVGSCRTGFSLKPIKRYAAFTDASDVDLAIISRDKFDVYWDRVFEHWHSNKPWSETRRYRVFLEELFKGWLWPRRLPPRREFTEALKWVEFEDKLGRVDVPCRNYNVIKSLRLPILIRVRRRNSLCAKHLCDERQHGLGRSRFNGLRSVGARLYRSWDRLESYQATCVLECKNALSRGNHE